MEDQVAPRKLRLRRVGQSAANLTLPQEDVIRKNLQPLKEHIEKKKRAQEAYYTKSSTLGTSPMIRDLHKQPVQQRLGRKVPFAGTNTSMVPPKKRLYKNTLNNSITKRKPLKRNNYAQMRINTIRENQRQTMLMENPNNMKRMKLRRMVPNVNTTNFKVQVRNNSAYVLNPLNPLIQGVKRHRIVLDSEIQLAINQLQSMYEGDKILIYRITPKATNIGMNDRFGSLSFGSI